MTICKSRQSRTPHELEKTATLQRYRTHISGLSPSISIFKAISAVICENTCLCATLLWWRSRLWIADQLTIQSRDVIGVDNFRQFPAIPDYIRNEDITRVIEVRLQSIKGCLIALHGDIIQLFSLKEHRLFWKMYERCKRTSET